MRICLCAGIAHNVLPTLRCWLCVWIWKLSHQLTLTFSNGALGSSIYCPCKRMKAGENEILNFLICTPLGHRSAKFIFHRQVVNLWAIMSDHYFLRRPRPAKLSGKERRGACSSRQLGGLEFHHVSSVHEGNKSCVYSGVKFFREAA